jgi:phospholipase C
VGLADIINAVGQSPCTNPDGSSYWNTTAILVVWDDWGGFWDHVAPYQILVEGHGTHCNPTQTFGCGYTSGFRVPFLVVSAYTPAKYVSGTPSQGGETFPYIHDFGSILAFIENNFLGSGQIGNINRSNNYPFADAFAPDFRQQPLNIPLADFFPPTTPRPFQAITLPTGAPSASDFINYTGPDEDPDNDAIDND